MSMDGKEAEQEWELRDEAHRCVEEMTQEAIEEAKRSLRSGKLMAIDEYGEPTDREIENPEELRAFLEAIEKFGWYNAYKVFGEGFPQQEIAKRMLKKLENNTEGHRMPGIEEIELNAEWAYDEWTVYSNVGEALTREEAEMLAMENPRYAGMLAQIKE